MGRLVVVPEWEPRLFVSPRRLTWRVLQSGVLPGVGSAVHARPAWLDDPGIPHPSKAKDRQGAQGED